MRKPGNPSKPFVGSLLHGVLIKSFAAVVIAGPGISWAAESVLRDEWVDAETGHRVVRLSRLPGESQSFYFHQNAFTRDGDKMVFSNTGTNRSRNLFVLDWRSRKLDALTDGGTNFGEIVAPRGRQAFYTRDGVIYATHLDTRATRSIAKLPRGWRVATINADETRLAGVFADGTAEIARGKPRSYWFEAIHAAKLPHQLFTVEIANGKVEVIHRGNDWFNHVQFSPADPGLIMFCHEGPWHLVDRIWNIRTDGSGLRLMHRRSITNEIAGHEFWSADGATVWYDLQMPRGETFFLAGTPVKEGKATRYPVGRDEWSVHFNISRDGKRFAGDGGAPNMVARAADGKWLRLFTPQPGGALKAERLVDMRKHDYALEPNVQFTPNGEWVVFRGNFDGSSQVYAVEVAKPSQRAASQPGQL
jgi:oligogalacturonide lyase